MQNQKSLSLAQLNARALLHDGSRAIMRAGWAFDDAAEHARGGKLDMAEECLTRAMRGLEHARLCRELARDALRLGVQKKK